MGKEREGLFYLGQFGGHDFYRADQFGENTVERYQAYMALLQQYDKLGLRKEDMFAFVNACIQLSNENKHKDLHTYLHQLNAFLQLEYSNDMVFELTNCFLLIDDEPMTKMSLKHSDLKRKLYKENSEVQLFFCECYNILVNKPESFVSGFKIWEYIRGRTALITESVFFSAINRASLSPTHE